VKPLDCPFVFVLWKDAVTRHGWIEADDDSHDGLEEVWSSGHMTARTRDEVRLVSDAGVDGSRNRRISIPLGMILRIHADSMTGPILFQRKLRAKAAPKAADRIA
jgi:hypothetical protein